MEAVEEQIEVGALYQHTNESELSQIRVLHIWVDDDEQTYVVTNEWEMDGKVEEFAKRINNKELIRINNHHESFRWRTEFEE